MSSNKKKKEKKPFFGSKKNEASNVETKQAKQLKKKSAMFGAQKDKLEGKTLIGLNLGSHSSKMVIGRHKNGMIEVDQALLHTNTDGVIVDGRINNAFEIRTTLENLLEKSATKSRDLICTIESPEIIERELVIQRVKDEDILGLVTFEMGQYLPIDTQSYVIQSKKIANFQEGNIAKIKVMVGAVPKGLLETYIEIFKSVDLEPQVIDITSNGLEKLIQLDMNNSVTRGDASPFAGKNTVVLDMGHTSFDMYFFENGQFQLNRTIGIGGKDIDDMIAKVLGVDRQRAAQKKYENDHTIGVVDLSNKFDAYKDRIEEIRVEDGRMLVETLLIIDNWLNEIDKVFKFFTTRSRDNAIDELFIIGGCSNMRDIDLYLERRLNIRTKRLASLSSIKYRDKQVASQASSYFNLLGPFIRY